MYIIVHLTNIVVVHTYNWIEQCKEYSAKAIGYYRLNVLVAKYWTSLASVQNTSHQATPQVSSPQQQQQQQQKREEEGPKARQLGHLTPSRWTENPKVKAYKTTKWHPITLCQVVHFLIKEGKWKGNEWLQCDLATEESSSGEFLPLFYNYPLFYFLSR